MKDYVSTRDGNDPRGFAKALKLKDQVRTAVIVFTYRGMNPKEVPAEHMKWALQHPLDEQNYLSKEQRARIDGPTKAVRAFCMNCQGNDAAGVRECAAVNCPLWAFRMGHNPFYGKLAQGEVELTDAEVAQELEEDNADGDPETV